MKKTNQPKETMKKNENLPKEDVFIKYNKNENPIKNDKNEKRYFILYLDENRHSQQQIVWCCNLISLFADYEKFKKENPQIQVTGICEYQLQGRIC